MAKRAAKALPERCSRVDCKEPSITRVRHDNVVHKLCKACWVAYLDKLDREAAPGTKKAVVDFKSQAAGDA